MTAAHVLILDEARRAHTRWGAYTSTHEALGVLLEEVGELRDAIRANDLPAVAKEATQVAAVAMRLVDACLAGDSPFARRSVP